MTKEQWQSLKGKIAVVVFAAIPVLGVVAWIISVGFEGFVITFAYVLLGVVVIGVLFAFIPSVAPYIIFPPIIAAVGNWLFPQYSFTGIIILEYVICALLILWAIAKHNNWI